MFKYYPMILGILDTLTDWNDKLGKWASSHMDNVGFGTAMIVGILAVSVWGIGELNKK